MRDQQTHGINKEVFSPSQHADDLVFGSAFLMQKRKVHEQVITDLCQ